MQGLFSYSAGRNLFIFKPVWLISWTVDESDDILKHRCLFLEQKLNDSPEFIQMDGSATAVAAARTDRCAIS